MRRILLIICLLAVALTNATAKSLFSDMFIGQNGRRPQNWQPAGDEQKPYWTTLNSELVSHSGNKQTKPGWTYDLISTSEASQWRNYSIEALFWNPELTGGAALVGRWKDKSNYYEAGVFSDGTSRYMQIDLIKDGKRLTLQRQASAPGFEIPQIEGSNGRATGHTLRLSFNNDQIIFSLDGKQSIQVSDSSLSAGSAGLGAKDAPVRFDNVTVSDDPVTATTGAETGGPVNSLANAASATPGAPAKDGYYVRVASNLPADHANTLLLSLQSDGYGPVDKRQKGDKYSVVVGPYMTEEAAKTALKELQTDGGYQPEGTESAAARSSDEKTVSSAEAGVSYRVMVFQFTDKAKADNAKKSLTESEYAGVDVAKEGDNYRVLIGSFPSQDEAAKLREWLRNDGYPLAQVVTTREDTPSGQPGAVETPRTIEVSREMAGNLTPAQIEEAKKAAELNIKIESGKATADEFQNFREQLTKMEKDVGALATLIANNELDKKRKTKQLSLIFQEASDLRMKAKWDEALAKIEEAKAIAPDDPRVETYTRSIEEYRNKKTTSAADQAKESIKPLIATAKKLEAEHDFMTARSNWFTVQSMDPQNIEAKEAINRLKALIDKQSAEQQASTPGLTKQQKYLLYGGIGAVVLILLFFTVILFQNTRRERDLIRQVQELAAHSSDSQQPASTSQASTPSLSANIPIVSSPRSSSSGSSKLMGASTLAMPTAPSPAEKSEKPERPAKAAAKPAAKSEKVAAKAPELPAAKPEEAPEAEAESLTLPGIDDMNIPIPGITESVETIALSQENEDSVQLEDYGLSLSSEASDEKVSAKVADDSQFPGINFDALLQGDEQTPATDDARIEDVQPAAMSASHSAAVETKHPVSVAAGASLGASSAASDSFDSTRLSLSEAVTPIDFLNDTPAPGAQKPDTANSGVFFDQNFDSEKVGTSPKGWQGEYDYASLSVDDAAAANGSGACLKFEKRSGAGSANYVCHFPNASGHVIIEFDLRCDDKNKYLLGFYIEKDEDFKQSVHTIIHRTDSKSQPSLRIHGEPIPYELGAWRHIRYDLNLMAGMVSAQVDEQQVVKDAKLATAPAYVNTLSIRDNLATTGVLYLDNIKIYKA